MNQEFEWLTLRETASALGVHHNTIRQWVRAGVIGSVRLNTGHRRFSRSLVERFVEERAALPMPSRRARRQHADFG